MAGLSPGHDIGDRCLGGRCGWHCLRCAYCRGCWLSLKSCMGGIGTARVLCFAYYVRSVGYRRIMHMRAPSAPAPSKASLATVCTAGAPSRIPGSRWGTCDSGHRNPPSPVRGAELSQLYQLCTPAASPYHGRYQVSTSTMGEDCLPCNFVTP